jgi:hypothetical protein
MLRSLAPFSDSFDRARSGANLLSVPLIDSALAPLLALLWDGCETSRPGRYRFVLAAKENE